MAEPVVSPAGDQYLKAEPAAPAASDPYLKAEPASPTASGQYFEAEPAAATAPRTIAVNIAGMSLRFATDSGVFSPDRLDAGTRLLLLEAPPLDADERSVLDLGCGWGPIACVTGLRSPAAEVLAVDVNERALRLTALNAEANGADNVTVARPHEVSPTRRFDRILCNPPIRIGKTGLHALLATWLDRLAPGGRAHLVVHRHLGSDSLVRWLQQREHKVSRLVSRSGYRLLEVQPRGDAEAATGSGHRSPSTQPHGGAESDRAETAGGEGP